jgi:hypothetical protein
VKVSYTTTLDDYVKFSMHTLMRSPSMKWRLALGWILLPVGSWMWAALIAKTYPTEALMLASGGALFFVVYPFFQRAWIRSSVRAYAKDLGARGVIGHITLLLEDDTLTESTDSVRSTARWKDMKGIKEVGDCTYIYVTGLLTAIIPRHGFDRVEDYEAVKEFAFAKLTPPTERPFPPDRGK